MPLKGDAKKVMKSMKDQYGKEKGEEVFYATANKEGRKPENWKKAAAKDLLHKLCASSCPTPGMKKRSRGKGRGKAYGDGKGPIGVPVGEKEEKDKKREEEDTKKASATSSAISKLGAGKGCPSKKDKKKEDESRKEAAYSRQDPRIGIGPVAGAALGGGIGAIRGGLTGAAGGILYYLLQKLRGKRPDFTDALTQGARYGGLGGGAIGALGGGIAGSMS